MASKDGYALEHRYVLYEAGVELPKGVHVHHRNGDKTDNSLANLEVKWPRDHSLGHIRERGGEVVNQHGRHRLLGPYTCETCGASYKPWIRESRYCSRECYWRRAK